MGSSLCAAGYHKTPSVEGVDDAPGDERPNPLPLLSAGGGTLSLSLSLLLSITLSLSLYYYPMLGVLPLLLPVPASG